MPREQTKTSARKIELAEKRAKALQLRKAGFTLQEIADQMGTVRSRVHAWIHQVLDETNEISSQVAGELRALENARLDQALRSIWPKVMTGNFQAIDRMIKISDQRSKLLGLYAPSKIAPTDPTGEKEFSGSGLAALLKAGSDGNPSA